MSNLFLFRHAEPDENGFISERGVKQLEYAKMFIQQVSENKGLEIIPFFSASRSVRSLESAIILAKKLETYDPILEIEQDLLGAVNPEEFQSRYGDRNTKDPLLHIKIGHDQYVHKFPEWLSGETCKKWDFKNYEYCDGLYANVQTGEIINFKNPIQKD